MSNSNKQIERIEELESQVRKLQKIRNPIFERINNHKDEIIVSVPETLLKAHGVLTYLMINTKHDVDTFVAPDARESITECVLSAIQFVCDNMENQEVEL